MKEEDRLSYRIHTRITKAKYEELTRLLSKSRGIHSLSELLRSILNNKKIITQTYDTSLDKVMEELSRLRRELQFIGININQITHRFHLEETAEGRLYRSLEVAKLYQQTEIKVAELFSLIAKLSELWLPKL